MIEGPGRRLEDKQSCQHFCPGISVCRWVGGAILQVQGWESSQAASVCWRELLNLWSRLEEFHLRHYPEW